MKTATGTTTKELFDQYYSTSNVVTRSSILSSLKSRVERGDEMAEEYVYDIEQTKALVKDNRVSSDTDSFTHEELSFIATHLCSPDDIKYYVLRGESSGGFELGGLIYQYHEDNTITLKGETITPTPEFLIDIINGYDSNHYLTKQQCNVVFLTLIENTPFTSRSFLSELLRIKEYVSLHLNDNYLPLHDCPSEYLRRALYTIDKFGIERVKGILGKSLAKRLLIKDVGSTSCLKITTTLLGGINVSDTHLPGLTILADNHRGQHTTFNY